MNDHLFLEEAELQISLGRRSFSDSNIPICYCGPVNTTIALARTIKNGVFSILLDPLTSSAGPGSLISSCRLVLTTPLSSCNATLSTQPFSTALQQSTPSSSPLASHKTLSSSPSLLLPLQPLNLAILPTLRCSLQPLNLVILPTFRCSSMG
ncbi:phylloplanin [Prunus dulcis]|uniref:Phylloplanin n=1 Tax=Prunus dulcis TaxID=3755 RepID=A0A5E4GCM0_PRUDU|nr:phylloplanin [Prunus dulcis]